jgi:hypothetical protein
MNLQARTHRRLLRHRPAPTAPDTTLAPRSADALLHYLAAPPEGRAPTDSGGNQLRDAAHSLMHSGEPLRLGLRAGELIERYHWFLRLLELWPLDAREAWLKTQVLAAQRHALAGSPLHEALDSRLFDPLLPRTLQLRLQALWLAIVAPGAVSLDATRREREQIQAQSLLDTWLRET